MNDDRTNLAQVTHVAAEEDAAVTARSAKGRARNILRTYTGWMIAINASLWVLWQVTEAIFPGSFLLLAMSRVPAATALALCSAVWYASMEREIALAVSRNAKAIYFIGVVFISKFAMFLVAVHASTEMVSACYLAAASTALHLGMVFADAVPPQCGRWFWRIGCTVVALNSAFFIYKTKSDPATYIEHYRMYQYTQNDKSGKMHTVFSTLDLWSGSEFVLMVLAGQIILQSLRSPTTTNVLGRQIKLCTLHTARSTYIGEGLGPGPWSRLLHVMDEGAWIVILVTAVVTGADIAVAFTLGTGAIRTVTLTFRTIAYSALFGVIVLCSSTDVLRRLLRTPAVWYNWLAVVAWCLSNLFIFAANRPPVFYASGVATGLVLMSQPLGDAVVPAVRRHFARGGSTAICVVKALYWAYYSATVANVYSEYDIPEWRVEGYVSLSMFDLLRKTLFAIALLSASISYRAWMYPEDAILINEYIPFAELHTDHSAPMHSSAGILVSETSQDLSELELYRFKARKGSRGRPRWLVQWMPLWTLRAWTPQSSAPAVIPGSVESAIEFPDARPRVLTGTC